jgi:hypothetical protein
MTRTSDPGCFSAARAYAQYEHVDKNIDSNIKTYSQKYKELTYISGIVGTINNRRFATPLGSSKFILDIDYTNGSKGLILYKMGW